MSESKSSLQLSYGPHIRYHGGLSTAQIMWRVNFSLIPALLWAVFIFGINPLLVTLASVIGALLGEYLVCYATKKPSTLGDGSAVCTGILLAFTLPPGIPFYMPLVGAFIAIILAKGVFGGLGYNIFNVALIGRAILMASFPVAMTTLWSKPRFLGIMNFDGATMATPLAVLKKDGLNAALSLFSTIDSATLGGGSYILKLVLGLRPGSIGEVSIIFILIGAIYLLYKRIIKLTIPVSVIAGAAIMGLFSSSPLIQLAGGGLWLGAFYMATDYVTSPATFKAQIIFGLGVGVITGLIRNFGGYPEGICYAILLMNIMTPALNDWFKPRKFSERAVIHE
jgi:Na+-translocating ferredoxin:NAD+ oxidoreductase subunit D